MPAIVLFAILSFNFQCGKDKSILKPVEVINIEIPVDIYPIKKTYNVGDTIWFNINFPDKIISDTERNERVLIDTVKFNIYCSLEALTKHTLTPNGGFCNFINPQEQPLTISLGNYDPKYNVYWDYNYGIFSNLGCANARDNIKIGIKLNTKGAFYTSLSAGQLINCIGNSLFDPRKTLSFKFNTSDANADVYDKLPKLPESDPYWRGFDTNLLQNKKAFVILVE